MTTHAVSEELAQLRRDLPEVQIYSATDDFLTASYGRTPFTTIKVTLSFPEGYPTSHPLIVAVQSSNEHTVVPPGLKKKLEKDLGQVATDTAQNESQVCAVLASLKQFIDTNRFVPCWKELKQCADLVGKSEGGKLTMNETTGKILITLQSRKYHYKFSIVIDEGYPSTAEHVNYGKPCWLRMQSTNFPPKIEKMLTSQAVELIKRLQDGMPVDDALQMSNPTHLPKDYQGDHGGDGPKVRLTNDALKNLKHDVETLSLVRDLREVDSATKQGNVNAKVHSKRERKDARRAVGKITAQEAADDAQRTEKERQWQEEEAQRMAGYHFTKHDGSNPQPSLLAVVTFLSREINRITSISCPICSQPALPKDPDKLKALYQSHADAKTEKEKKARRIARQQRPERVYCGCWYHHSCLDKYMTEPPFGAECAREGCERGSRVYHPDWSANVKELERAWAGKQARAREIADAAMFL